MRRALALAGAISLLAAAPSSATSVLAHRSVLVAYGTGLTTCTVAVAKWHYLGSVYYDFSGETDCSAPVQQTGRATFGAALGTDCAALTATCLSDGGWDGEPDPGLVYYRVTLVAPFGQGWAVVSPESANCSGMGSDHLSCTFTADDVK